MLKNTTLGFLLLLSASTIFHSCKSAKDDQWEGQGEIQRVFTQSVPVQPQYKGVFDLGNGIFASNDFDGARLNGINLTNDTLVTTLITPENTPINGSPWYSFKIWSTSPKDVDVKLTYLEGYNQRYLPKISKDGRNWETLDSSMIEIQEVLRDGNSRPVSATLDLSIGTDTTWISAQEVITKKEVDAWMDELATNSYVNPILVGESHLGQSIDGLKIGTSDDQAMIVILSRQHPPEVTGYLAMKAFIETISSGSELATAFRGKYNTYVVPLANPDGVKNGHWRHNNGGVDLNRDWGSFNQPETAAIRDFFLKKTESGGKIYFFADFHSTWHDIYYTIDPEQEGNMPGLVPKLITEVGKEFPDYNPNIRPSPAKGKNITSTSYFFTVHGAESLTYELGDNTPREFIREKGEVTATKLMELMLE